MKHLLYLTKLMEECGEVVQACSKVLIYGEDAVYNGETGLERLQSEMTDVLAAISIVSESYGLDNHEIADNIKASVEKIVANIDKAVEEQASE